MSELRQPYTPLGIANETLDETITINEDRREADHHMVTGPTKNILRQSSPNSNPAKTLGANAELLYIEHPGPPDPINQIPQAIEKQTFDIERFKLITPRLHSNLPKNSADKLQHPLSPNIIKTTILENDITTTDSRPPTPDTHSEYL